MKINVILAHCRGYGIGYAGKMSWRNGTDLQRFARLTTGRGDYKNAIVMGRKTWQSLPYKRPLAKRDNLILSRQQPNSVSTEIDNTTNPNTDTTTTTTSVNPIPNPLNPPNQPHSFWFSTIDSVLAHCAAKAYDEVWIIGGEQLYSEFLGAQSPYLPLVHTVLITCIDEDFTCDTFCSADIVSHAALRERFTLFSVRTELEQCTNLVDGNGVPAKIVSVSCYEYRNLINCECTNCGSGITALLP